MKKKQFSVPTPILIFATVILALALMGQGRDDWRYGGRINGKMSIRDSLTVGLVAKFESTSSFHGAITATSQTLAIGAVTSSGKSTLDSLKVNGRLMVGMNATTGQTAFKASNAVADIAQYFRSASATAVASIDTAGNATYADLAVNGGDLTSTATTFNLLNATVTTLNIGGAATTLGLGASTGTATVNNTTLAAKALTLSNLATFAATGQVLTLRTIAAGDSVFLKVIVDAADTTLKAWNGSAWVTIKDLIP